MTYAILGASGSTGSAILALLLRQNKPDPTPINLYVRSKAKLLTLHPHLASNSNSSPNSNNVHIFEGLLTDIPLLTSCIRDTHAVFLTVAVNDNVPHTTVAQDTARVVLAALDRLRQEQQQQQTQATPLPRLIVLSAAAIDDNLMSTVPRPVTKILRMAFSWLYADLTKAETVLREHASATATAAAGPGSSDSESGVKVTFIKPGALVHDAQKGHALSTERAGKGCLGYLDLAAGMIEAAGADSDHGDGDGDRDEGSKGGDRWKWEGKNVSVLPTGKGVKVEWKLPIALIRGLMFHFVPGVYVWLR